MPKLLTIRKGTMTKTITPYAWDLMGENKNGWELAESSDQIISNEVVTSRGKQPEVIDAGPVINEVVPAANEVVSNEVEEPQIISNEVTQSSFVEEALKAKIKPGMLKDYCDINGLSYKQKDKPETLLQIIGDHLNGDIEKFKSEFGI